MLSIPTLFDLIATVLMNVGLLYVTASVYQMMRGAGVLELGAEKFDQFSCLMSF